MKGNRYKVNQSKE